MVDQPAIDAGPTELTGFEKYSTETLLKIRGFLDNGLLTVLQHEKDGTLDRRGPKGAATPREAGYTFEMLGDGVDKVLRERQVQ